MSLWKEVRQYKRTNPLAYRLLVYILLVNSLLTLITTAIQLYIDLNWEISSLENRIELIFSSYNSSITNALWSYDIDTLQLNLEGILHFPNIKYLELTTSNGEVFTEGIPVKGPKRITRAFVLWHSAGKSETFKLGTLEITASLKGIYESFFRRILIILITNFIKIFPTSFSILFIFYQLVTRHLNTIIAYMRHLDLDHLEIPLTLNRDLKSEQSDELTQFTNAINAMRLSLAKQTSARKKAVSELVKAKEAAERASHLKSKFLDIAAHELRTPTTSISIMLDLARKQRAKGQPVEPTILDRLSEESNRLSRLVVDLLDVSRLERGLIPLHRVNTDIVSLISRCVERFRIAVPRRSITFTKTEIKPIEIDIDPTRIDQVLSNLIDNAARYSPETSSIEVSLESLPYTVRVSVIDHGPGIPKSQQDELFTLFTRGSTDEVERTSGLGLGLFLCRNIIAHHQGIIGFRSAAGIGSTFYFELPKKELKT